jgi:hypothetical protein
MSKASHAAARADFWFHRYVAMGTDRSIRALAARAQQVGSAEGGSTPKERTLFRWSSDFDWDHRARIEDARAAEQARSQLLHRRANESERRSWAALDTTDAFRRLIEDALTVEEPVLDDTGNEPALIGTDGHVQLPLRRRPARFRDLARADIYALIALHNVAFRTDRSILGNAAESELDFLDRGGSAEIKVLGPEALQEMSVMFENLVQTLDTEMKEHRAEN